MSTSALELIESIAHMGTDCPPAMDPEAFYRYQLHTAIHRAAVALGMLRGDPEVCTCGARFDVGRYCTCSEDE